MKLSFLLSIFSFIILSATAQKQTYFLFAAAQKSTQMICAEKVLIKSGEIELTTSEAEVYARNYQKELQKEYSTANKYKNLQVSLIRSGNIVIQFQGERKYTQKADGWDCTSTFYGIVVGADNAAAEKKLAALKAEYKLSTYEEMKRWGSILQSIKNEDLEVKWVKTKAGVTVFLKNTKKDGALKILIKCLKGRVSGQSDIEQKDSFDKMTKIEDHSIELQPGASRQLKMDNADAFEIDISPVNITEPGSTIINQLKHQVRKFITKPDKIEEAENIGVRG
ncbi:MAG TPA: hypothetical protein VK668_17085 [Mucilaginibacter sp.]|nr:hypothetical protein [Mucilaginibacter sp.]